MAIIRSDNNTRSSNFISENEFKQLELRLNSRDKLIISIFRELGLSVSELTKLRVSQFRFEQKQLLLKNRVRAAAAI